MRNQTTEIQINGQEQLRELIEIAKNKVEPPLSSNKACAVVGGQLAKVASLTGKLSYSFNYIFMMARGSVDIPEKLIKPIDDLHKQETTDTRNHEPTKPTGQAYAPARTKRKNRKPRHEIQFDTEDQKQFVKIHQWIGKQRFTLQFYYSSGIVNGLIVTGFDPGADLLDFGVGQ